MSSIWISSAFFSWIICTSVNSLECSQQFGFEIQNSCRINGGAIQEGESLTLSNTDPQTITLLTFSGTSFPTLPQNIFVYLPQLDILYVSNNDLKRLIINDFKNGLKLKEVFFYKNQLQVVPTQIFRHSLNIEKLTFTTSPIQKISKGAFNNLKKLKYLSLTFLPLTTFPSNMLANLTALEQLEFENCEIKTLPQDFFRSNRNLNRISLTGNGMGSLSEGIFDSLEQLEKLDLQGNNLLKLSTSRAREVTAQNNQLQELHITMFTNYVNVANNFISKITCDVSSNVTNAQFSNNSLSNFNCLREMTKVFQIYVDENKLMKLSFTAFDNLRSLKTLKINGNLNLKATAKHFSPLTKLSELWVDRLTTGYKNLRQQYPNLSMLYLTTKSWNCSFLKQVANTLNNQKIYLRYINDFQDFANFKCQLKMWEVSKFT